MLLLKTILITIFFFILFQDVKERQVHWFLFPIVAIISGFLFFKNTIPELFIANVLINLLVVLFLFAVIYFYAKFKLKTPSRKVFGLGDALLFLAIAFSFSSISYIVIFVFSLIFSLTLHLLLNQKNNESTVPLAGYMSLFFMLVYISNWVGLTTNLYRL